MISFLSEPLTVFHYGTWSCDSVTVTITCDVTQNNDPSSKNKKLKINWKEKIKNKKENKIK